TPPLLLLHVPPVLPVEVKLMLAPVHTDEGPLMVPASSSGLTVMVVTAVADPQVAVDTVYVIVVVPAATPVTRPVDAFTVAAAGLLLIQVPPTLPVLVRLIAKPAHTVGPPVIVPA